MPEATHPSFSGAVQYTAEELPNSPELATAITIQRMDQYIREDAQSAEVSAALKAAVHPLMQFAAPVATMQLIFRWVKDRVTFRTDARTAAAIAPAPPEPWTAELLIRPVDLLRMNPAEGDCDDFSMLTAAMLLAAGYGAALVTIAADKEAPGMWSHVFALAIDPETGERIAMDTSHGSAPGWEYPHHTRRKVWMIQEPMQRPRPTLGTTTTLQFPQMDTSPSSLSFLQQLALIGANTGSQIASSRYGNPPAGTYQQTGPNGSTYFRQGEGGTFQFPTVGLTGSQGTSLLVIAGLGIAALMLMSRR